MQKKILGLTLVLAVLFPALAGAQFLGYTQYGQYHVTTTDSLGAFSVKHNLSEDQIAGITVAIKSSAGRWFAIPLDGTAGNFATTNTFNFDGSHVYGRLNGSILHDFAKRPVKVIIHLAP